MVAPASGSFMGSVTVKGKPDSQDLVSIHVDRQENGFAAGLVMDRAQRSVRQEILYASLPSGISLSVERFTAQESITVERLEQGFLRIINEHFPKVPGNADGYRDLFVPGDRERFHGGVSADPDSDVVRTYDHPAWINIGGRLGIRFDGSGNTVYHNRHFYKTWWAVADDLVLSRLGKRARAKPGQQVSRLAALVAPGRSPRATERLTLTQLSTRKRGAGLIADGHLAVASFEPAASTCAFTVSSSRLPAVPVFEGTVAIRSNATTYTLDLEAGQAALLKAMTTVEVAGSVDITSAGGRAFAHNAGRRQASVKADGGRAVKLRPGAVARIK